MKKIYTSILLVLISVSAVKAQDSQFSLYDASPVILNPALTGTDKETVRAVTQYRNQWRSVSSSFVTSTFAADIPIDRWGVGAYVSNNETARLISELNFVVSGSYDVLNQDQNKHHLSVGANVGFINKRLDPDIFIFDSQFEDNTFNTNIDSGEDLAKQSRLLPELSFGLNYKITDKDKMYHPYVGAALFHLTRPNESFVTGIDSRLPIRYMINAGTYLNLDNGKILLNPKGIYIGQGRASDFIFGLTGDYIFNDKLKANAGISYRVKDAIITQLGISYLDFTYLMAYDINVSGLSEFSNNRGAIEFSLIFNIRNKKVKNFFNII